MVCFRVMILPFLRLKKQNEYKPLYHRYIITTILAIVCSLCTGCIAPESRLHYDPKAQDAVKIAVILPLSGANQSYGERILDGVKLAREELNNLTGINNRPIELIIYNTESNPVTAAKLVPMAVSDGAVAAVAGYSSAEVSAMDKLLRQNRLPVITPMATINEPKEKNPFLFRATFTDSQQGHVLAAYAWYWRKLLRLGVIMSMRPDDEYSRSVAREAAQAFKDYGGTVVCSAEFPEDNKNSTQVLRSMLSAAPQAIVIPMESAISANLVKKLRTLGYQGLLLGSDSWDEENFMRNCGSQPGDCAYIAFGNEKNKTSEYRFFCESFHKKYSRQPGSCEAQGYDSLKLLAIGLADANSIEKFTSNLLKVHSLPGAAGAYTFLPPNAELDRTMYINTIRPAASKNQLPYGTNSLSFPYSRLTIYQK